MPPKPTPGDLAQNSATEELLRRRKAEQLARRYEREETVFGVKTISIVHERKLPPKLTPEDRLIAWSIETAGTPTGLTWIAERVLTKV